MLSVDQIAQFERDGFLVLPEFESPEECAALRARANELVERFEPTSEQTTFTTDDTRRRYNDEFLDSAYGIWCFFESDAFDSGGSLSVDKAMAINKIGHAMHDLDSVFETFTYTSRLASVARDIGFADPLVVQSMYIFKQPYIGGEVGCHQDATFLYTEPITVTGFWFAIEDSTLDNGCLWVEPGGHRGPLRRLNRRVDGKADLVFEELSAEPLPTPPDGLVPVVVPGGTMVILHGLLPHWSDANRSPVSRHAYTVHCIDATSLYPSFNWLQRPQEHPLRSLCDVARASV